MRDMLHLYGGDAVDLALRMGPLLTGLRKGSRRALGTAFDYIDDGLPVGLVVWSRPDVRRVGERTEIRLVTGDSTQLVIDFPRDVGPRS